MLWGDVEAVVAGLVELRGSGMEGRPRLRGLLRGSKDNVARSVAVYLARMCCALLPRRGVCRRPSRTRRPGMPNGPSSPASINIVIIHTKGTIHFQKNHTK